VSEHGEVPDVQFEPEELAQLIQQRIDLRGH